MLRKARPHFLAQTDLKAVLQPADENGGAAMTKLIATAGPACNSVETLSALLEAGMNVLRIDLTWGSLAFHRRTLQNLQRARQRQKRMAAVMIDTLGREMMIKRAYTFDEQGWPSHTEALHLRAGQQLVITARGNVEESKDVLPITYPRFPALVRPGDLVYVGRYLVCGAPDLGSLYLKVEEVDGPDVVCRALNDAEMTGLLTVYRMARPAAAGEPPRLQSDLPLLSDYDKMAITALASEFELDWVALSYTRSGADVAEARAFLDSLGAPGRAMELLAKVEDRLALHNFAQILDQADGIILSRGNMGMDLPAEKITGVQKAVVTACNMVAKPIIITRVVDTMVEAPKPTRAEATDVANAVLDGIDGILLGAETLRGAFPVQAVSTVLSICHQAERVFDYRYNFEFLMQAALAAQEAELSSFHVYEEQDIGDTSMLEAADAALMTPADGVIRAADAPAAADPTLPTPPRSSHGGSQTNLAESSTDAAAAATDGPPAVLPQHPSMADAPHGVRQAGSRSPEGKLPDDVGHEQPSASQRSPRRSLSQPDLEATLRAMTAGYGAGANGSLVNGAPGSRRRHGAGGASGPGSMAGSSTLLIPGRSGFPFERLLEDSPAAAAASAAAAAARIRHTGSPYLSRLEAIASSAVRAAEKVRASLILCFTHTHRAAQLIAKYRPPMPILTLVVPRLVSDGLRWRLEGGAHARQSLITRGLLPMLTAPGPSGDDMIEEAVAAAAKMGLVQPHQQVVCVERLEQQDDLGIKIVSVDELGQGVKHRSVSGLGGESAAVVARAMVPGTPVVGRMMASAAGVCRTPRSEPQPRLGVASAAGAYGTPRSELQPRHGAARAAAARDDGEAGSGTMVSRLVSDMTSMFGGGGGGREGGRLEALSDEDEETEQPSGDNARAGEESNGLVRVGSDVFSDVMGREEEGEQQVA